MVPRFARYFALIAAVLCWVAAPARAQSGFWLGSAATGGLYSNTANWSGGAFPTGGGVATFDDTWLAYQAQAIAVDASPTLSGITFAGPFSYTLNTSGLNTITTTGTFTVSVPTAAVNSPTGYFTAHTINAPLVGNGGLTKTGAGQVTLTGTANTFTGNVVVNGGSLNTNVATDPLGNAANTLTINNNATFRTFAAVTLARPVVIGAGGATFSTFASPTLNGTLSGTGTLTRQLGGTLTIGGNGSAFTGAVKNESGTLLLNANGTLGGTAALDLAGGLTLTNTTTNIPNRLDPTRGILSRGLLYTLNGNAAGTNSSHGALTLEAGSALVQVIPTTLPSSVTFESVVRKNGSTIQFLAAGLGSAPAGAVGNVLVTNSPGTLIGGGGAVTTTTASVLPYASGATSTATTGTTVSLVTWDSVTKRIVPLDPGLGYNDSLAAAGPGTGTTNFNQGGSGAVTAGGAAINSLRMVPAANMTISGGPLTVNSGAILSASATATVVATISAAVAAPAGTELVVHAQAGAPAAAGASGGLNISGVVSGTGGLTKAGGGVLILSGANTYTGPTSIQGGHVLLSGTVANDGATPGPLGLSTTPIQLVSSSSFVSRLYAAGADATINRNIVVTAGGSSNAALGVVSTENLTVNGNIQVNNPTGALGTGYLALLGGTATTGSVMTVNGVVSGTGGLTAGTNGITAGTAHTVVLNGANTYSGGTNFSSGTTVVTLGHNEALGTGVVYATTGVTFQAGNATPGPRVIPNPIVVTGNPVFAGTDPLYLNGSLTLNGLRAVAVNGTSSVTITGVLRFGSLLKNGTGTLAVTNPANTTAFTQINGGTLLVGANSDYAGGAMGVGFYFTNMAGAAATDNLALLASAPITISRATQIFANATGGTYTLGGTNTSGTAVFSDVVSAAHVTNAIRYTAAPGGTVRFTGAIGETAAGVSARVLGGGTVQFAAANTYSGPTTVDAGTTLEANNTGVTSATGTGAVTSAGTLRGTGRISGAVATNDGSTIMGGTGGSAVATNTLTLASTLTTDGAVTIRTAFSDTNPGNNVAEQTSSRIAVTGAFDKNGGGVADAITIRIVGSEYTFDRDQSYTLTLVTYGSTTLTAGDFAPVIAEGFTFAGTPSLVIGGTALTVTFVPTPEPASVFGVLTGLTAAGAWVRRRRAA